MRLSLGGYTHAAMYDVDFRMEPQADGLWGWEPRFAAQPSGAADAPTEEASPRKPSGEAKDKAAVFLAIQGHAGPAVARALRDPTKLSHARVQRALAGLLEEGTIRKVTVTRSWRKGTRSFDGYEPTAAPPSISPTG
jgi:hypothetical protein